MQELVPDQADPRIGLVGVAMLVVVDLHQLMLDLTLEQALGGVEQRAIEGDVFLLDLADLGVQLPGPAVAVLGAVLLVEVVGLGLPAQ
jgi:hypothetical protein